MGGELQRQIQKALNKLDQMIVAIKATGGYKERKKLRLSAREIDQLCTSSESAIRKTVVSLVVAEAMLREPAPSIHPRCDEYQRRRAEIMAELRKR